MSSQEGHLTGSKKVLLGHVFLEFQHFREHRIWQKTRKTEHLTNTFPPWVLIIRISEKSLLGGFSCGFWLILFFGSNTLSRAFHVSGVGSWVVYLVIAGSPAPGKTVFPAVFCLDPSAAVCCPKASPGAPKFHVTWSPEPGKIVFSSHFWLDLCAVVCFRKASAGAPTSHLTTFFQASRIGKTVVRLFFVVQNGNLCPGSGLGGTKGQFLYGLLQNLQFAVKIWCWIREQLHD